MPQFFPENNVIRPTDDKLRTTAKWCAALYAVIGEKPCPFPEGTAPKPGDSYSRLLKKINAMLRG